MAKKRPTATVKLERGRLVPVTGWDSELLSDMPNGTIFNLVCQSPRSVRHHSMYWAQLGIIVKATEAFATADHMHTWIKCRLSYTSAILGPKGEVIGMTVDSTAFDKMTQAEFSAFYEKACRLIAQEMGIDMSEVHPGWGA